MKQLNFPALLLALVLAGGAARAEATGSRTMRLSLDVQVPIQGPGPLRIWIPLPQSGPWQEVRDLGVKAPFPMSLRQDPEYGNRYAFGQAEGLAEGSTATVRVSYTVTRYAHPRKTEPGSARLRSRFSAPDRWVPLDGAVSREAVAASRAGGGARALYDHIVRTMAYDKSKPGWGRGDALRACDVRAGNCTDFHSLFIGMARSQGIPARFVMGHAVPPEPGPVPGYHCWAEYWDGAAAAWIPVDASEASKHPEKRDFFFGNLDADRIEVSLGRDVELSPAPAAGSQNFISGPIAEINGQALAGLNWVLINRRPGAP